MRRLEEQSCPEVLNSEIYNLDSELLFCILNSWWIKIWA